MPSSTSFGGSFVFTHISTATALLDINGVIFITDPAFDDAPAEYVHEQDGKKIVVSKMKGPAMRLDELPPIDCVLLSHEDHIDNLDTTGRILLNGRVVATTQDGAKNLAPRPGVHGFAPWQTETLTHGGISFKLTAVPCTHLPGGECVGFLLESPSLGETDGLPNAIYFSGDTIYFPELADIRKRVHVSAAVLNLGGAKVPVLAGGGLLQITMDGKQAAQLVREIGADVVVPMHFESWTHFTEDRDALAKIFEAEGIADKICWSTPGKPIKVL